MSEEAWNCPPLKVGDVVRARVSTGGRAPFVDCGTWRVTEAAQTLGKWHYLCAILESKFLAGVNYSLGTDFLPDWEWRMATGSGTEPTIEKAKPLGSTCRRPNCPEPFNPYAEPTRLEDRTHVCHSCRADGWGVSWGEK
jgi:hypothetical protein